ncbi:hypothetical protein [Sphingomonas aquatilis]
MALSRKRRRRISAGWSHDLDDLHDYIPSVVEMRASPRMRTAPEPIVVTDDWPDQVPITDTELRIIEGHLADELDALFGPLP